MIKEYKLFYKVKNYPWKEYDRTRDQKWAVVQFERMKKEYPGAEYIVEPKIKEKKKQL